MKQYCRYCCNAIDYMDVLVCRADAPCGNNGSGATHPMEKAKRLNHCKHFEFNPNDLLGCDADGNFRQYKPREAKPPSELKLNQISFGGIK